MTLSDREDRSHGPRASVDRAEFERWYDDNRRSIYRYVARSVDSHVAEDLTAATFAEAWRCRASYDPGRGSATYWLLGIAGNLMKQHYTFRRRQVEAMTDTLADRGDLGRLTDARPPPAELVEWREALRVVTDELAREDLVIRHMVYLLAVDGLSYAEIAEELGVAVGTVRSRLSRVRDRLALKLSGKGIEAGNGHRRPATEGRNR